MSRNDEPDFSTVAAWLVIVGLSAFAAVAAYFGWWWV